MQDGTSCLKDSKSTKKRQHRNCLVPSSYQSDPELVYWVSAQCMVSIVDDKMKQEHHNKLNLIGFVWMFIESNIEAPNMMKYGTISTRD